MSFHAFVWAWDQKLAKDEHLIVLLALANISNEKNEVYAGQSYIAAMARKEERTVRRALVAMLHMDPPPISVRARPGTTDVISLNIPEEFMVKMPRPPEGQKRGRRPKSLADSLDSNTGHGGEKDPSTVSDEPIEEPRKGTSDVVLRAPDPFDAWWAAYPRKMAKVAARKAWVKVPAALAAQGLTLATLMERTRAFADHVVGKDAEHIAHPATWLNGERWNDELPDRSQTDGQSTRPAGGVDRGEQRAAARIEAMVEGARYAADPRSGRRRWKV